MLSWPDVTVNSVGGKWFIIKDPTKFISTAGYLGLHRTAAVRGWNSGVSGLYYYGLGNPTRVSSTCPCGQFRIFAIYADKSAICNPPTLSGTVFEDVDADLLDGGQVGDTRNAGISGVTVRLFDNAGQQVGAAATTDAAGAYTLSLPTSGTYYVAVDAPTVSAAGTSGVVGEQTYARAGSGNTGAAGGAGYGTLCVSTNGSYTQQNATTTSGAAGNPANGACYGGRRGATADSGTTALNFKEHVIRVVTDAGSPVTNVDFGFSFNVVTNVNDSGQGSVRQFIANANAITAASGGGGEPDAGANVLRFVPALAMNGSDWWQVAPTAPLPAIGGPRTTIDGRAYDNANGTSALLRGAVGTGGLVGADWNPLVLSQVASPKLALANGLTADALTIAAGANDTTIRNIGIFGTTANSGNGISGSGVLTGLRIEGNVIGVLPDQSSAAGTVGNGILLDSNTNGSFTIANNYIADSRGFGGILATSNTHVALGSYIISGNQIVDAGSDAINLGSSSHVTVSGNLLQRFTQSGVDLIFNKGFNLVEHNTIAEGSGPQPEGGVRLLGDTSSDSNRSNIVRFNKLVNNAGTRHAGITVSRLGAGNRLTENQFGGNSGNAIDNIDGTGSLPDGVTVRTGCTTNTVPLGRPVLSSAILVDNTLRLEGSYCGSGTYRLELYKVAPGSAGDMGADGLQAGEGGTFLAALTGLSGGTLDETLSPAPGNLVAGSDHITAILIRETATGGAVGDTSEFSANVLAVSVPFVTLAKVSTGGTGSFIFNGSAANANGFPTDDTYSLATTAQDVAVEGAPVPLSAADVATEIIEAVPPGWVLETARCEDRRAATTGNPVGPVIGSVSDGRTLVIPAANARAGADLLCTFSNRFAGFAVTGRVIEDNGAGGGTAHDGHQNGTEKGLGAVLLRLTDCASHDYARAESDAAGNFSLSLAGVPANTDICLVRDPVAGHLGVSGQPGTTGGTMTGYNLLRFRPAADTSYHDVVFGLIAVPQLVSGTAAAVPPGGATMIAHRYTATTTAAVSFTLTDVTGTPDAALFSTTLFHDADCSGELAAGEGPPPAPAAVQAGDVICLLVRTEALVSVPPGGELAYTLAAATALSGTQAVLEPAANQDKVTVATGSVTVTKRVRNVTRNGSFAASGTGAPGDVLEYSIIFSNPSSGAVSHVQVHDKTPSYTTLSAPMTVVQDPASLDCAPAVPPAGGTAGYRGVLRWDCTGTMLPGDQGEVSFKVTIDQ
uniref:Uncharacterized protein n=3 Tax=Chelativorans TaxID=449972 RepID=Q11I63_CHESB